MQAYDYFVCKFFMHVIMYVVHIEIIIIIILHTWHVCCITHTCICITCLVCAQKCKLKKYNYEVVIMVYKVTLSLPYNL